MDDEFQKLYAEGKEKGYLKDSPELAKLFAEGVKKGYLRDLSGGSVYPDSKPKAEPKRPGVTFRAPQTAPAPVVDDSPLGALSTAIGLQAQGKLTPQSKPNGLPPGTSFAFQKPAPPAPVQGKGVYKAQPRKPGSMEQASTPRQIRDADKNAPRFSKKSIGKSLQDMTQAEAESLLMVPDAAMRRMTGDSAGATRSVKAGLRGAQEGFSGRAAGALLGSNEAGGAANRAFAQGAFPGAGGLAGFSAGARIGSQVPGNPIVKTIAGLGGGMLGAAGGGAIGQTAQDLGLQALIGREGLNQIQQQTALDAQQNPLAVSLGNAATNILYARPTLDDVKAIPTIINMVRSGTPLRAALQSDAGRMLSDTLRERAMEGGIEVLAAAGQNLVTGKPMDWRDTGIQALSGALMPGENRLGRRLVGAGSGAADAVGGILSSQRRKPSMQSLPPVEPSFFKGVSDSTILREMQLASQSPISADWYDAYKEEAMRRGLIPRVAPSLAAPAPVAATAPSLPAPAPSLAAPVAQRPPLPVSPIPEASPYLMRGQNVNTPAPAPARAPLMLPEAPPTPIDVVMQRLQGNRSNALDLLRQGVGQVSDTAPVAPPALVQAPAPYVPSRTAKPQSVPATMPEKAPAPVSAPAAPEIKYVNKGVDEARVQQGQPPYYVNWQENGENQYAFYRQPSGMYQHFERLKAMQDAPPAPQSAPLPPAPRPAIQTPQYDSLASMQSASPEFAMPEYVPPSGRGAAKPSAQSTPLPQRIREQSARNAILNDANLRKSEDEYVAAARAEWEATPRPSGGRYTTPETWDRFREAQARQLYQTRRADAERMGIDLGKPTQAPAPPRPSATPGKGFASRVVEDAPEAPKLPPHVPSRTAKPQSVAAEPKPAPAPKTKAEAPAMQGNIRISKDDSLLEQLNTGKPYRIQLSDGSTLYQSHIGVDGPTMGGAKGGVYRFATQDQAMRFYEKNAKKINAYDASLSAEQKPPAESSRAKTSAQPSPRTPEALTQYTIEPYRYAKDSIVVKTTSPDQFKTPADNALESLGGRYVDRAGGYVFPKSKEPKIAEAMEAEREKIRAIQVEEARQLGKAEATPTTPQPAPKAAQAEAPAPVVQEVAKPADNEPVTLASHAQFFKDVRANGITPEELLAQHDRTVASKAAIVAELNKKTVAELGRFVYARPGEKKADLVQKIYEGVLNSYTLDKSVSWQPFSETYEQARGRVLKDITQADIDSYIEKRKDALKAKEKEQADAQQAIENPQTFDDYRTLIRAKGGIDSLTPEQKRTYEDLLAEKTKADRKAQAPTRAAVPAPSGAAYSVVEHFHSKRGANVYITVPAERMDTAQYQSELSRAKALGGYYSRAWQDSPGGFAFKSKADADTFSGNAPESPTEARDGQEDTAPTNAPKNPAAERLRATAERMEESANEALNRDRKVNTAKRASQAASAEADANRTLRIAKTMRAIADAIESGTAKYLDGVKSRAVIEDLDQLAKSAKWEASRKSGEKADDRDSREPSVADIDYVEYPYPGMRRDSLKQAIEAVSNIKTRRIGKPSKAMSRAEVARLQALAAEGEPFHPKRIGRVPVSEVMVHRLTSENRQALGYPGNMPTAVYVYKIKPASLAPGSAQSSDGFVYTTMTEPTLGKLSVYTTPDLAAVAAVRAGEQYYKVYDGDAFIRIKSLADMEALQSELPEWQVDRFKRLQNADIKTPAELKAALREYLSLASPTPASDPIKKAERELIGRKIPGYFPTPPALVEKMLGYADIQPGMSVLEPSAGKGNIADAIREAAPDATISAIEPVSALRTILEAKGHELVGSDFLEHEGEYDRIVMNPPFEDGQDMKHVRHAYDLLKPGGKLVAITSEGPFYRSDKKAQEFRQWLEETGGESEKNPDKSFMDSERSTGVATRIVTIEKPANASTVAKRAALEAKRDTAKKVVTDAIAADQNPTRRGSTLLPGAPSPEVIKAGGKWLAYEVAIRGLDAQQAFTNSAEALRAMADEFGDWVTLHKDALLESARDYWTSEVVPGLKADKAPVPVWIEGDEALSGGEPIALGSEELPKRATQESVTIYAPDTVSDAVVSFTSEIAGALGLRGNLVIRDSATAGNEGTSSTRDRGGVISLSGATKAELLEAEGYSNDNGAFIKGRLAGTIAHELGHHFLNQTWADADMGLKNAVVDAYEDFIAKSGNPRHSMAKEQYIEVLKSRGEDYQEQSPDDIWYVPWTVDAKQLEYQRFFHEWFANQVKLWVKTDARPRNAVERFFRDIAAKIADAWKGFSRFTPTKAVSDYISAINETKPEIIRTDSAPDLGGLNYFDLFYKPEKNDTQSARQKKIENPLTESKGSTVNSPAVVQSAGKYNLQPLSIDDEPEQEVHHSALQPRDDAGRFNGAPEPQESEGAQAAQSATPEPIAAVEAPQKPTEPSAPPASATAAEPAEPKPLNERQLLTIRTQQEIAQELGMDDWTRREEGKITIAEVFAAVDAHYPAFVESAQNKIGQGRYSELSDEELVAMAKARKKLSESLTDLIDAGQTASSPEVLSLMSQISEFGKASVRTAQKAGQILRIGRELIDNSKGGFQRAIDRANKITDFKLSAQAAFDLAEVARRGEKAQETLTDKLESKAEAATEQAAEQLRQVKRFKRTAADTKKANFGTDNEVFKRERYEAAKARLEEAKKAGRLNCD